jgi:hypothetical protein
MFVPLATDPYNWFASGSKRWEVRRRKGAYGAEHVKVGRRVELRRGYRESSTSLWGTIEDVHLASTIAELLSDVPFGEVVPGAIDQGDAISIAAAILKVSPEEPDAFIAFRVRLDPPDRPPLRLPLSSDYRLLVKSGDKTTTVRRGDRAVLAGPALLCFGPGDEVPAAVTAVSKGKVISLSEHDAHRDGFAHRGELLMALRRHYPDLEDGEDITVLEFRCLL